MPVSKKITNRPLTPKQAAFVKHVIDNPKDSYVKAALTTYGKEGKPPTYSSANEIARENLQKPAIVSALAAHNQLVENTLLNTVKDYANSDKLGERALAVDTSKYIHDKIHGKATQRIEQQTTGVTLNLDLTSALTDTPD